METSGIRLQANKSATSRVRIRIRRVLGTLVKPPLGKKCGASFFCKMCSNRKKAMVIVIRPALMPIHKERCTILAPPP